MRASQSYPDVQGPGTVPLEGLDQAQAKSDWATKLGAKFFEQLKRFALETGAAVDILAAGMAAVNAPLLSIVASGSGGVLLLHQSEPLAWFPINQCFCFEDSMLLRLEVVS